MATRRHANPYHHAWDKPHYIDRDEVENLVYEVFTTVWASKNLKGTETRRQFPPLVRLLEAQAEARLSSHMLQLAMLMRTLDDLAAGEPLYDAKKIEIDSSDGFGHIFGKSPEDAVKPLLFRDACNKIIHAIDFRPTYDRTSNNEHWTMSGVVELTGFQNREGWMVDLNLFLFLPAVLALIRVKPSEPSETE